MLQVGVLVLSSKRNGL